jgi:hypothetical protein
MSAVWKEETLKLLHPDVGRLDDRPPLLDFAFLLRGERLWRLFVTWPGLLAKLDKPLMHGRICQGFYDRGVDLGDDLLRRAPRSCQNEA